MQNKDIEFNIDIEGFSGPLDVLDTLIRENKMDILDLNISLLANQYYEFIKKNFNKFEIDKLSNYLVMATYLLELKTKKILQGLEETQEESNFEYERDKLVAQIIEYRKYKEVCERLNVKREKRQTLYAKPSDIAKLKEGSERFYIEKLPSYIDPDKLLKSIISAYEKYHFSLFSKNKIIVQELSVDDIKKDLISFLNTSKKITSFGEYLFSVDELKISEQYIVTTFLALLELVKYDVIVLEQNEQTNEIIITIKDLNNSKIALGQGGLHE